MVLLEAVVLPIGIIHITVHNIKLHYIAVHSTNKGDPLLIFQFSSREKKQTISVPVHYFAAIESKLEIYTFYNPQMYSGS